MLLTLIFIIHFDIGCFKTISRLKNFNIHISLNIDYTSVWLWRPLFCMANFRRVWNKDIVLCNISMVTSEIAWPILFISLISRFAYDKLYSFLIIERNHKVWPQENFTRNRKIFVATWCLCRHLNLWLSTFWFSHCLTSSWPIRWNSSCISMNFSFQVIILSNLYKSSLSVHNVIRLYIYLP